MAFSMSRTNQLFDKFVPTSAMASIKVSRYLLVFVCLIKFSEGDWRIDDDGCVTPNGGIGSCIPKADCKHVTNPSREYYCGVTGNSVKICCPNTATEKTITEVRSSNNFCKTPDNEPGKCIPIKQCKAITDFIQTYSPLSANAVKQITSYQCEVSNSVNVCCPRNAITIRTETKKPPAVSSLPPKNECRTPDKNIGVCVAIKDCKFITDFIQKFSPLTPNAVKTLQSYQCGSNTNSVNVCCPNSPVGNGAAPDVTNHKNFNLLPYECGVRLGEPRISMGNKTVLFEFPWMALLSYKTGKSSTFLCGGTIINERYILTAAHCLTNLGSRKLISVRVGEYNISSAFDCEKEPFGAEYCAPPVQDIAIEEIIPHPKFDVVSFASDIGLIRLSSPINLSVDNAKPICLPITPALRNKNFKNANLMVTGWGVTETGERSADLLKVDVPVITEENCRRAYKNSRVQIGNEQICGGGINRKDACLGDSGGPAQTILDHNNDIRSVQFGVVSFGPKRCGQIGSPGVFTRVEYYMNWILDNMRI